MSLQSCTPTGDKQQLEMQKKVGMIMGLSPNPELSKMKLGKISDLSQLYFEGHSGAEFRATFKLLQRHWKLTKSTLQLRSCRNFSLGYHVQTLLSQQVFVCTCPLYCKVIPMVLVCRQHDLQPGQDCPFGKNARTPSGSSQVRTQAYQLQA